MDRIVVDEEYNFGILGLDESPIGPMYRALRNLLAHGKPGDRSFALFFDQSNNSSEKVSWLGVMTFTAGKRVLFFPSTRSKYKILGNSFGEKRSYVVDHLTLEPNLLRSHITSPGSKIHTSTRATKPIGGGFHWFTVHYQSAVFLHPLYRRTRYSFEAPQSDSKRRLEEFSESRKAANSSIVRLNPDVRHTNHNHVGFSVFVGRPGFNDINHIPVMPSQAFTISPEIRMHRLKISDNVEIQITSFCTSAYLTQETIFYF